MVELLAGMELSQRERDANRMGMLELAKSGGMGDFRVLAQSEGSGGAALKLLGFSHGERTCGKSAPDAS